MTIPAQDQQLCPAGGPCILGVYNEGTNLIVTWNDEEVRDHYNLRWSRSGKSVEQVEVRGGSRGRFTVKDFLQDTLYTFAVQGCRKPLIGRSECTDWNEKSVTSCGARATPCRAVEFGFINAPWLSKYEPFLGSLRSEPRFRCLMEAVRTAWRAFEP